MHLTLTRRDAVRAALVCAVAGPALLRSPPRAAAASYVYPRPAWLPHATIDRTTTGRASDQFLWSTVMRVDDKLSAPLDRFYLWVWTHDANFCRLYTMPSPAGPYRFRQRCPMPAWPSGWDSGHISAGDVVWDPGSRTFLASPHSKNQRGQATFLLRSADGINWSLVSNEPIVPHGADIRNDYDGYEAAYGRFLRDMDGNLERVDGKAILYYRGERWPTGNGDDGKEYTMAAAYSTDLVTWSKHPANPIHDPLSGALHGIGSALTRPDKRISLILSVAEGLAPLTMYMSTSDTSDPYTSFPAGPGEPIYQPPDVFADGGAYVVDVDNTHYMSYAGSPAEADVGTTFELYMLKSPAPALPI